MPRCQGKWTICILWWKVFLWAMTGGRREVQGGSQIVVTILSLFCMSELKINHLECTWKRENVIVFLVACPTLSGIMIEDIVCRWWRKNEATEEAYSLFSCRGGGHRSPKIHKPAPAVLQLLVVFSDLCAPPPPLQENSWYASSVVSFFLHHLHAISSITRSVKERWVWVMSSRCETVSIACI